MSKKFIIFFFIGCLLDCPKSFSQKQSRIPVDELRLAADIVSSAAVYSRPALPDSFLSAGSHFKIFYTTVGKDSVARTDENTNLIPDRIEKIADAFEKSFTLECRQMNYQIPPSMKNESAPYDVYVIDLVNQYATTIKENFDSTATILRNVSSYILFDNDFVGSGFHIQGDNAIKVIAAHEFFHAIQLGYVFRNSDSFFFEASAVWMEDQVFDEVDNYLYYLDYFFSAPEIPLNGVSFTIPNVFKHIYGTCIFCFYIEESFGAQAILQSWQLMPEMPALEAIDLVFKNRGSNFEAEFVKFCMWNYFTGARAVENFSYQEAAKYPKVRLLSDQIIDYYFEGIDTGYFLTADYYQLQVLEEGIYRVSFSAENSSHWRLAVISWHNEQIKSYLVRPGKTITLDTALPGQKLIAIPCNIDRFANPTLIYFKEPPENYHFSFSKEISVSAGPIKSFHIESCFPNPYSEAVNFQLRKISDSNILINIFNCQGQLVDKIYIGRLSQPLTQIKWLVPSSNRRYPSGLYFFQFSDGRFTEIKKLVLCR